MNKIPDLVESLKAKFQSKLRVDKELAKALYCIFENTEYVHKKTGYTFSCTFRAGARIVAEIRDLGETYIDFYCSRPYNHLYPSEMVYELQSKKYAKAYKMIKKCGWIVPRLTLTEKIDFKRSKKKYFEEIENDIRTAKTEKAKEVLRKIGEMMRKWLK